MKAEIVAVGTELLLGQIANTNARDISESLAAIGVDVYFHSVVGDNLGRVADTIRTAAGRSDVVIVTGGLGPTPDDLTREAVAAATGRTCVRDERLVGVVESIFERMNRPMPESNLRQADLPEGAVPIEPEGTAPGFWLEHEGTVIFAVPGVPWEMKAMVAKTIVPRLRERGGTGATVSREVVSIGLGESATHELIADLVDAQSNPTIAYRAGGGSEVRVRLTAKAAATEEALALIDPVEVAIRERLGESVLPPGTAGPAEGLAAVLLERSLTLAAAESLTGGLIGETMTRSPGASRYFLGSLVCYTNGAKTDVAGVDPQIITRHGAVSAEVARALALAARERFGADVGISATGVAGPEPHDGADVGTIFVGAAWAGQIEARKLRGYGDRANMRLVASNAAIELGRRLLLK